MVADESDASEMRRQSVRRPVRLPYENKLGFGRGNGMGHPTHCKAAGVVGASDLIGVRSDGTYLVKASGPVKVRFRSATNQDVDIELHAIDAKGKTGDIAKKLTLRSRAARS